MLQMFNHQTHHRGQVHAILTRLGVDMGPTDIPLLPVLENAPAAAPPI
ncbi:MAG: DinB family protein [Deltaproteobacteria bacterium]